MPPFLKVSLSLFAGIISAFVDNVATVLMVAPIAVTISKKLKISPVASVIAISVVSNLQGAATLVGDTTSIMLGGAVGMNFLDFFWYQGRPGIFWVVEVGALVSTLVLLWVFRKDDQTLNSMGRTKVTDFVPTFLLVGIVVLLVIASFIENKPATTNGIICMVMFGVGLMHSILKSKKTELGIKAVKSIDLDTIVLLASLFVVIGGLSQVGIITDIGDLFVKLGGNITPIGASANITGIGILRKEGYEVSTKDFMRISVPFTLSAVVTGYILLWVIWGLQS